MYVNCDLLYSVCGMHLANCICKFLLISRDYGGYTIQQQCIIETALGFTI